MKVSAIIVTWNSESDIAACLDSVLSAKSGPLEILVADNASQDGTPGLLRGYGKKIVLVENRENLGFARAVNQGLERARGEYLLLLNPDATLEPGALEEMLSFLDQRPQAGAVGPQLLNPDGTIQPSCREFPRPSHLFWKLFGLSKIFPRHPVFGSWRMGYFDHRSLREVDQPMGACLLVRGRAAHEIGPMDDGNFPMFFNEVDWCLRLKQHGWAIFFNPRARAVHRHGASTARDRGSMIVSSHKSLECYLDKYFPRHPSAAAAKLLLKLALPIRRWWAAQKGK